MALGLYLNSSFTNKVSEGTGLNPDDSAGSGSTGYNENIQLWVYNDSTSKRYEDVNVTSYNDSAAFTYTYSLTETGTYSDDIDLPDIGVLGGGSNSTSFWRKITVASGQSSQNVTNIKHRITATEYAV